MNKCKRKKYIRVNFPPLIFLLNSAKIPRELETKVNPIRMEIKAIFVLDSSMVVEQQVKAHRAFEAQGFQSGAQYWPQCALWL